MSLMLQIAVLVISLLEIALIGATIYYARRHFRVLRASSYIERFNSQDMLQARVAVDRWLHAELGEQQKLAAVENDAALNAQLRMFANLFEELGVAYLHRIVDRQIVRNLFDGLVITYWRDLRFWVDHVRSRSGRLLYVHFEQLAGHLR